MRPNSDSASAKLARALATSGTLFDVEARRGRREREPRFDLRGVGLGFLEAGLGLDRRQADELGALR